MTRAERLLLLHDGWARWRRRRSKRRWFTGYDDRVVDPIWRVRVLHEDVAAICGPLTLAEVSDVWQPEENKR